MEERSVGAVVLLVEESDETPKGLLVGLRETEDQKVLRLSKTRRMRS